MNHTNDRISPQTAQELLALASHLENQKHQEYVPDELMQAATEAGISADTLQAALHQIQARQIQQQAYYRQLWLALGSGLAGAVIALLGVGAYARLNHPSIPTPQIAADTNAPTPDTLTPNNLPPDGYAATYTGTVQQYLLNPEGRVDGLLLKNGFQIKIPPHLSQAVTNLVKSGTEVSVTGTPGTLTRFGQEIRAIQITNHQTQQVLPIQPSATPPSPPGNATNYSNLSTEGTVHHWLVGHRGELNGAILTSDVQIKFAPPVGEQLLSLMQGNNNLKVQGFGIRSPYGEVIEATILSINGQTVAIAPQPPKKLNQGN